MKCASRRMRRRRNTDKWEVALSHKDPITGEQISSYHAVEVKMKTQRQAERRKAGIA